MQLTSILDGGTMPAASFSTTDTSSLIGRGDDLAALDHALARARHGEPVTVVVGGEAGMGKTCLVDTFTERAAAAGARLLSGACVDVGDATLPYGAVMDALRAVPAETFDVLPDRLRRALATLIPEAAPDAERFDGGQAGVFGAVLRLLEHLGTDQPVVLVLEDLHWADGSTEALVRFLARGLHHTQLLLVLTYRTDEVGRDHPGRRLVAELGRRGSRVQHRVLAPLTASETARQLGALAGTDRAVDDATRAAIHARSEGNPFYTEELLAAGAIPATLRETLLTRLDRLPPPAQRVAVLAAACGRHVEHDLLAAVCELEDDVLDQALRACVDGHVLAIDHARRGYRFRHALLAEVAASELLPGERQRLHARIAELLDARPAGGGLARAQELAEIAHHRLRGHDRAAGLAASVRAARAAEDVHALAEARRHYDAALELWEAVEDAEAVAGVDLPFLLERCAECCWLGFGNAKLSARLREQAIATLDPATAGPRRAAYLARLAVTSSNVGVSSAMPLYEEALGLLDDDEPSAVAAEVRARYANALMLVGRYDEASDQAMCAIDIARVAGARRDEADAGITLAVCRQAAGDVDGAIALFELVRPFAARTADARVLVRFYTNYSHVLGAFARYEEAAAIAVEGIAAHEQAGLDREAQISLIANGAAALNALGRAADARELMGDPPVAVDAGTICLHDRLAQAALIAGAVDDAAARLDRARALPGLEPYMLVPTLALAIEVALWQGDVAGALALVAQGEAELVESARLDAAPLLALAVRAQADAAAAGLVAPDVARASAGTLVTRLQRIAWTGEAPLPEVDQLLVVAIAERARLDGSADPAAPWRVAVAGWDALGRPYDAAYARWRLGEALAATRADRDELAGVVRAGHAAAARMGSDHLAATLERLARRARVPLPPVSATTGDAADGQLTPLPDLTAREREVLALVADGRTNRQIAETLFITEKTASVHVSNIMRKLGAANRGAAAAIAHRAGLAAADA